MSELWARFPVGGMQEEPNLHISGTLMFLSLSFSLPSPLSKNKQIIFLKKVKYCKWTYAIQFMFLKLFFFSVGNCSFRELEIVRGCYYSRVVTRLEWKHNRTNLHINYRYLFNKYSLEKQALNGSDLVFNFYTASFCSFIKYHYLSYMCIWGG